MLYFLRANYIFNVRFMSVVDNEKMHFIFNQTMFLVIVCDPNMIIFNILFENQKCCNNQHQRTTISSHGVNVSDDGVREQVDERRVLGQVRRSRL